MFLVYLGVPSFSINSNLFFPVGHSISMSPSLLNLSNAEAAEKIFVVLYNLPQNVDFVKMSYQGEERRMPVGSNFTSRELQDGWVFLKNSERKAPQGILYWYFSIIFFIDFGLSG